ncbi:MAG: hypothetical protein DBW78_01960 [Rhodothermaeota bacterium MED-G64]|nr:MAG: hypothetical protein DBW78_01960 [Rhodothermaeota bacterium MED-G64]
MSTNPRHILVLFGAPSPEHEVSILTGLQVGHALLERHPHVSLGYVDKAGQLWTGDPLWQVKSYTGKSLPSACSQARLRKDPIKGAVLVQERAKRGLFGSIGHEVVLDVAVLAFHGGDGEGGAWQGYLESLGIPFVGSGSMSAALAQDKSMARPVLPVQGHKIAVADALTLQEQAWVNNPDGWVKKIAKLGKEVILKPARLGSSIGVERVSTKPADLRNAIERGFQYDDRLVFEELVSPMIEINCSVRKRPDGSYQVSACEQPVASEGALSFEDKYMNQSQGKAGTKMGSKAGSFGQKGNLSGPSQEGAKAGMGAGLDGQGMASLKRLLPAPIEDVWTQRIQDAAVTLAEAFQTSGVVRFDFMVKTSKQGALKELYFNECNTIPGSLSFYLWQESGVTFPDLLDEAIEVAKQEMATRIGRQKPFESNLLKQYVGS